MKVLAIVLSLIGIGSWVKAIIGVTHFFYVAFTENAAVENAIQDLMLFSIIGMVFFFSGMFIYKNEQLKEYEAPEV